VAARIGACIAYFVLRSVLLRHAVLGIGGPPQAVGPESIRPAPVPHKVYLSLLAYLGSLTWH
jgi:hypothetical protein